MRITAEITETIDAQDQAAWEQLCSDPTDPFMKPGFIRAMEGAFAAEATIWSVLFQDEAGQAIAAACICRYRIDAALLAGSWSKKIIGAVRRLFPGYLRFHAMFCGLPLSAGQSHVRFAPGVDRAEVVRELDRVIDGLARKNKTRIVIYKEFCEEDRDALDALCDLGYNRADSVAMNTLDLPFDSFESYCAAMKNRYRYEIRRSLKKFEKEELRVEHLRGNHDLEAVYTEDVHRLYHAVLDRASSVLEVLPVELPRELRRQLEDDLYLLVFYREDRIVAFMCGIIALSAYYPLYAGVDYTINRQADLYFNLFYKSIAYALESGVSKILLGPNADHFKARLGCRQQRRYFYIKVGGLLSFPFRMTSSLFLTPVELIEPSHVFRDAIREPVAIRTPG